MIIILTLLVLFQLKHFLADFPLQTKYMLGKFNETGWILPLFSHAVVHAVFTFIILGFVVLFFGLSLPTYIIVLLSLYDLLIHFSVDYMKVTFNKVTKCTAKDNKFWYMIGLDQMLHHFTHYAIIMIFITLSL